MTFNKYFTMKVIGTKNQMIQECKSKDQSDRQVAVDIVLSSTNKMLMRDHVYYH